MSIGIGKELHLTKKDFKLEWFSGTGAGGQHRNKHQNCCRITHIASGLRATGQEYRERARNQDAAFRRLASKLISAMSTPLDKPISSEVIRTYHEPRNCVKDKASGLVVPYKVAVIDADIGELIEARAKACAESFKSP